MASVAVMAGLLLALGHPSTVVEAPSLHHAPTLLVQDAFPTLDTSGRDPSRTPGGVEAAKPTARPKQRSLVEQGADVRKANGNRNSVRVGMTENRTMRYDVQGRAHHVNGVPIETPHKVVETRVQNPTPHGRVYTGVREGTVEPMNQADMRIARRFASDVKPASTSQTNTTPTVKPAAPTPTTPTTTGAPK